MKRLITTFIVLGLIIGGCNEEKFLERPPIAETTDANFPVSANDLFLATNAVYNTLRIWNFNEGGFPILSIISDDMTKGSNPGDGTAIAPYDNFTNTADEGSIYRWWSTLYQGIRRANLVINSAQDIEMDETLKNRYLGEARFLRAYFYSLLVRAFGPVPKVLEINPDSDLTRSDVQEIMDEIIVPDFEFAITNLPEKSDYDTDDNGRATRGAAKAMLARVYLYFGDFDEVERLTLEIIGSAQYDLETNYGDAFSESFEYGQESVFEVGALGQNFDLGGNQYANTFAIRGDPNRGWGFGRPAYSFILEYGDDPRMDASVIFLGEVLGGVVTNGDTATPDTTYNESNDIIEIECYNQKTWVSGGDTQSAFAHNKRVIRYADVLLMAAEALNENDDPDMALMYLERVRNRARGGDTSVLPEVTTTDKALLRDAILDERRFELAFEGLRYWDLVRTGRANAVLGPLGFIEGIHELLPIPQSEVDISEGAITQNFGY